MKKSLGKKGSSLIAILMALVIIGLIFYFAVKNLKKSTDNPNKTFIKEAGVDASSYKRALDSTKKVIHDAQASREQIP